LSEIEKLGAVEEILLQKVYPTLTDKSYIRGKVVSRSPIITSRKTGKIMHEKQRTAQIKESDSNRMVEVFQSDRNGQ
jgi:hypothetical protein